MDSGNRKSDRIFWPWIALAFVIGMIVGAGILLWFATAVDFQYGPNPIY
jgi:hypothetical protein